MQQLRKALGLVSLALITLVSFSVQAQPSQTSRFLSLTPPEGLPIIPVMEGWIANDDGSRSFSFGYINRNDVPVTLPLGDGSNWMEPAEYSGMQPTYFPPGRGTGVFTVTVPADKSDIDVWWYLKTGSQDALKVPGRAGISAYELDFVRPRPQGAMQPHAGFGDSNDIMPGLMTPVRNYPGNVKAGEEVTLTVRVNDISERDPTDPRFKEPLPVGVHFHKHQGPGDVTFTLHPETEVPTSPYGPDDPRSRRFNNPDPSDVSVAGGNGLARVLATFSAPGEYIVRAQVENFTAPDSSNADQCCWTNVFQRITVTP